MSVNNILLEATAKLISLNEINEWQNELLSKAPPVLWFGNSKSEKEKILTVGANPSRWEFLDKKQIKSCSTPFLKECYESKYLSKRRFYHLSDNHTYNDILTNNDLRNEVLQSFDKYFETNPYNWFGLNKDNSYNSEGLLRGLGASYFEVDSLYRACHIDIFPFATISDFNKIRKITNRDILADDWAKKITNDIISYFNPKLLLIFGRANFNHFSACFDLKIQSSSKWEAKKGIGTCNIWQSSYLNYPVIGVSANLGNPKGFNADGLNSLGDYLGQLIEG
jgi:hypothetical protein